MAAGNKRAAESNQRWKDSLKPIGTTSMEKGQTGCTSGEDPVDCKMTPWSELGSHKVGVFTPGWCTTDNNDKEIGYGKKCAYHKSGTGKDNAGLLDADKTGIMYKMRTVERGGKGGGDNSCKYEETKLTSPVPCNRNDCPVNCKYTTWGEWKKKSGWWSESETTKKGSCAGSDCDPWGVCARTKEENNGWTRTREVEYNGEYGGRRCYANQMRENKKRDWYITRDWNC